ncbi:hypothetical protein [Acinetobacter phage AB1I1M-1]
MCEIIIFAWCIIAAVFVVNLATEYFGSWRRAFKDAFVMTSQFVGWIALFCVIAILPIYIGIKIYEHFIF